MAYRILLVALEIELPYKQAPKDYKVVYTGVGKVNAAYATTRAISEAHQLGFSPTVINYGTVGTCRSDLSGMHRVTKFIQRDMNCEPIELRGTTPFEAGYPHIDFGVGMQHHLTVGTGDQFVHEIDHWLVHNEIDLVDMEAYAIAHVCKKMNADFTCYKYITDTVGTEHQADTWRSNVDNGVQEILRIL
jgi:adenosylhomocysteine nucleosidase